ncbi:MAG TPA: fused MFS/spermidine synthase, partial [Bryobacteraceae bacterium]|nr:fused MFS/spermidine synthase [Bryobacteraceae bacterium]
MQPPRNFVLALYGCTIFLSSFLLFLIQPIFAKLILPWFGGSAAVWITCLVFFQVSLLLGYFYADLVAQRIRPSRQAPLHGGLLIAALLLLPALPSSFWKPSGNIDPTWRILGLLTVVLGLPFFLLSATSPLLQSWYARAWPGSRPYRLFALSNFGSLLALIGYPVLIEPRMATRAQDIWWSVAFAVFAVLCGVTAWMGRREAVPQEEPPQESPKESMDADRRAVPPSQNITWIALAAGGSMLLLATTNQLTQNVAAVPFLWILPLALYLVTFILCFESSRWYKRGLLLRLLAVALGSVGYAIYDIQVGEALLVAVPVFALGLFVGCMFCHGELSARKPAAKHLTSFYLTIALGGAIGGIAMGLIAPHVLDGVYELPISLLFVAALALWLTWQNGWSQRMLWSVVAVAMAVVLGSQVKGYHRNTLLVERSFYGVLRVVRSTSQGADVRTLYHGTIKHGAEWFARGRRMTPTTYYGLQSGVGLALRLCCGGPKRVGVIGLGTGTVAVYGGPGDVFRFYEINPQVLQVARSLFTYLRETPAHVDVTLGDARLSLESEPAQGFDVLIVDAFSGDAIPVHLLTKEAFALYLRHLKPGGILAVHVSNQFLELAPVVQQLAAFYRYPALRIHT